MRLQKETDNTLGTQIICSFKKDQNLENNKNTLPRNAVKNIKSVPSKPLSGSPSAASVSIANIVRGCCGDLIFPDCKIFNL